MSSKRPADPVSDSGEIPHSLDTILYLLKRFEKEQRGVQEELITVTTALVGVQVRLTSLSSQQEKTEAKLAAIETLHVNCTARRDIVGVNARLKKIEERDHEELKERVEKAERKADESTRIDTTRQVMDSLAEPRKSVWSPLKSREIMLVILLAIIIGTALGSIATAKMFGADVPTPPISGEKNE